MHSNEGDFLNLKKLKWGNFVHFQKNTEKGSSLLIFKKNIEVTAGPTKKTVRSSPTSTLKCEPLTPKISNQEGLDSSQEGDTVTQAYVCTVSRSEDTHFVSI